jgi:hypothetical protein
MGLEKNLGQGGREEAMKQCQKATRLENLWTRGRCGQIFWPCAYTGAAPSAKNLNRVFRLDLLALTAFDKGSSGPDQHFAMRRLLQLPQRRLVPPFHPTSTLLQPKLFRTSQLDRTFHTSRPFRQEHSDPLAHRNFYRTHGRALFKALTLAFFTYQVVYWAWLVVETEGVMREKNREIQSLESQVRLLSKERSTNSDSGEDSGKEGRLLEGKGKK